MVMRKLVALMVTSLAGVALVVLPVGPAHATIWWLQYSDRSIGQCMQTGTVINAALVSEAACLTPTTSGAGRQKFQLALLADGNQLFIAQSDNTCVQVLDGTPGSTGPIAHLPCNGTLPQEWRTPVVKENANGSVDLMFRNAATGTCISTNGGTQSNALIAQPCNSADARQVWHQHLREAGGGAA